MRSVTLTSPEDKNIVRSAVSTSKVFYAAVARLHIASPDPSKWTYSQVWGAAVFCSDKAKNNSFFIRLVDIVSNKGVIWEQEFYEGFNYVKDAPFFHSFETDDCLTALEFVDEGEADVFYNKVQGRDSLSMKKAPKSTFGHQKTPSFSNNNNNSSKRRSKVDKNQIGMPADFRHLGHIGYTPGQGFSVKNNDPEYNSLFDQLKELGISADEIDNNQEFIQEFLQQNQPSHPPPTLANNTPPPPPLNHNRNVPQPPTLKKKTPPPPPPPGRHHGAPPPPPPPRRPHNNSAPPPPPSRNPNHNRPVPPPPPSMGYQQQQYNTAPPPPPPPPMMNTGPPQAPPPPPMMSTGPPQAPPPPPMMNSGPPQAPPPPPMISTGPPQAPPPPTTSGSVPPISMPAGQDGRGNLMASIRAAGGFGTLKQSGKLRTADTNNSAGSTVSAAATGAASGNLASSLADVLKQRKQAMVSDDEDDDDDEWD